jgi:hypothetical protein
VTGWREDDGVLREAYQAAVSRSSGDCAAEDVDRIWQAVAGELDVEARRDLIDRMAIDPALAQAWRVAVELDRARGGVATSGRQTTRWLPQAFMGLAAAAIIAVGIRVFLVDRAPADTFRAGAGTVVESLIASDAALPADAFVLRWKPGPAGTRYALRVTTEDLRVLANATDLTASEFTVPRESLAAVPPGSRVLWQVVMSSGGETISSQTFVVRVQ